MTAPVDYETLLSAEEAQRRAGVYREFAARFEAEYAALPPGDMHRPGLSVHLDEARDNVRVMETIIALHQQVAEQREQIGQQEVSLSATIGRLREEKAELRTQVGVVGDTQQRIAAAWNQIAGHFLVSPSPANAERIARLACAAADVRDEATATRDEAVAEVRRLTAALATVTTERDALLAVCERFAGDEGVICNGYEDDSGCGSCGANANHSDADPANHAPDCARLAARVLAAKIRALPLDAPGGGS